MEDNLNARRIARQRARRRRRRIRLIVTALCLMMVLCAAAIGVFGFWLPWRDADSAMPAGGRLTLQEQSDGTVLLSWPQGEQADAYRVEILESGEILYSADVGSECQLVLSALPRDRAVTIRVSSARVFRTILVNKVRLGENPIEATAVFTPPRANMSYEVQLQPQGVRINLENVGNNQFRLYLVGDDGQRQFINALTKLETVVSFGADGDLPLPADGTSYHFEVETIREEATFVHYGLEPQAITVSRDDLLGSVLGLTCTDEGNNAYTLRWNETRGEFYEIQRMKPGSDEWVSVCTVSRNETLRYTTPYLQRYSEYRYRVIVHGQPEGEEPIETEQVIIQTGATPVYATIWPLCNLDIYADSEKTQVIGQAPEAKAYCVLGVEDGMFCIRHGNSTGYIDSNYCMINLPEYLGDICLYNITNSYDSCYTAHEYEIPEVTGTVITGYENVKFSQGDYLVPLLYPVAQRLEEAAFMALEKGYRLKIYDSYRPGIATQTLYRKAVSLSDQLLPEYPINWDPSDGEPEFGGKLTYFQLMTDSGRYTMSYFLAAKGSRHNQGLALDLTLVRDETGEELKMQTSMHDLSWYSELKQNNANANLLSKIMKGVGFAGLSSEWWHFQDDEVREQLGIDFYLSKGVSGECWMASDQGWQYRLANGHYYANTTAVIDGVTYTFDEAGYVVQPAA